MADPTAAVPAPEPEDEKAKRPHCGQWPFWSSDLDLVMPEDNAKYHQARGCCDG